MVMKSLAQIAAALEGYDPQALSVPQVQAFLEQLAPLRHDGPVETLPVMAAGERILARDVVSPVDVPPHDNSAMDGFAFAGSDLSATEPTVLQCVGHALAGAAWAGPPPQTGQCLRITTGAIMPAGLDTVVAHEMVQVQGERITIPLGRVHTGDNRRLRGEDIAQGQAALRQGQRLTPAAWGLLASLGLPEVAVRQRLRVAYFSTGDEILSLGQAPREGAVYDSNRYTVCGLLQRMGCEWIDLGVVPDDPQRLRAAFEEAAQRADAIITSGGVSVGEADHTKALMRELGDVDFWRIAMRPGRPMAVGRMGQTLMFGLPGNPVAVMVTFLAFVRPALWRMMGCTDAPPLLVRAQSQQAMRKKAGRTEYQRGVVTRSDSGTLQVHTTGNQGSGVLSSMVQGNALIVLHHDQGHVAVGDPVDVMLFDGAI
jgi:molybdopterin molybdotransferase